MISLLHDDNLCIEYQENLVPKLSTLICFLPDFLGKRYIPRGALTLYSLIPNIVLAAERIGRWSKQKEGTISEYTMHKYPEWRSIVASCSTWLPQAEVVKIFEFLKEQNIRRTNAAKTIDSKKPWNDGGGQCTEARCWWAGKVIPKNTYYFLNRMLHLLWLANFGACQQFPREWPARWHYKASKLYRRGLEAVQRTWSSSHSLCPLHEPTSINRRLVMPSAETLVVPVKFYQHKHGHDKMLKTKDKRENWLKVDANR